MKKDTEFCILFIVQSVILFFLVSGVYNITMGFHDVDLAYNSEVLEQSSFHINTGLIEVSTNDEIYAKGVDKIFHGLTLLEVAVVSLLITNSYLMFYRR